MTIDVFIKDNTNEPFEFEQIEFTENGVWNENRKIFIPYSSILFIKNL